MFERGSVSFGVSVKIILFVFCYYNLIFRNNNRFELTPCVNNQLNIAVRQNKGNVSEKTLHFKTANNLLLLVDF